MNRVIALFIFIFVTIFASAYMLMQQAIRPAPAPVPAPAPHVEVAKNDDSAAKDEKGGATKATLVSDSRVKQDEEPSRSQTSDSDPPATIKQGPPGSNKPAASPRPGHRSTRHSSQRSQQPKQFVSTQDALKPKPHEVNGGIWDEDLDRLQGTWRMVDAEYDGNRIPDEAKKYSWEFKVDEYKIKNNDNFMELWVIEVNSSRRPKTIDGRGTLTSVGPTSGRKLMGIYEVTDDELKVCYDLTGNGRPDSFKADKGSRRAVYFFKR